MLYFMVVCFASCNLYLINYSYLFTQVNDMSLKYKTDLINHCHCYCSRIWDIHCYTLPLSMRTADSLVTRCWDLKGRCRNIQNIDNTHCFVLLNDQDIYVIQWQKHYMYSALTEIGITRDRNTNATTTTQTTWKSVQSRQSITAEWWLKMLVKSNHISITHHNIFQNTPVGAAPALRYPVLIHLI